MFQGPSFRTDQTEIDVDGSQFFLRAAMARLYGIDDGSMTAQDVSITSVAYSAVFSLCFNTTALYTAGSEAPLVAAIGTFLIPQIQTSCPSSAGFANSKRTYSVVGGTHNMVRADFYSVGQTPLVEAQVLGACAVGGYASSFSLPAYEAVRQPLAILLPSHIHTLGGRLTPPGRAVRCLSCGTANLHQCAVGARSRRRGGC